MQTTRSSSPAENEIEVLAALLASARNQLASQGWLARARWLFDRGVRIQTQEQETPAEHIRNALAVLDVSREAGDLLSETDARAIRSRLWKAIDQLEGRVGL